MTNKNEERQLIVTTLTLGFFGICFGIYGIVWTLSYELPKCEALKHPNNINSVVVHKA